MSFGVKLEARKTRSGGRARISIARLLSSTPTGAAYGLATEIKARVFRRGDPVDKVPPHDSEGKKLVSPRYPGAGGAPVAPSGARIFDSGQAFQRRLGVRKGTYSVSGGLAEGLTVVATSRRGRVQFRGRSEGQEPSFRGGVAKGRKVSNALKSATVLAAHGVNLLRIKSDELEALTVAIQTATRDGIPGLGGFEIKWTGQGRPRRLARRILAAIRGRRSIR